MEKKKLKLSISGSQKKTISTIEQAKSKSKNTVVIEKKSNKFGGGQSFARPNYQSNKTNNKTSISKKQFFQKPTHSPVSDFEKRKLAEQRATRRLKGETNQKEFKTKSGSDVKKKRRELKLTVSSALNEDDIGTKGRSLASLRRAKQKENRELKQNESKESLKPVKRDVNIPEVITIRE